jgi:DNA polymerase lambda
MFKDVYGVGRVLANELYRKGARTMEDLRTKDFGLNAGQLVSVEWLLWYPNLMLGWG